MTPIRDNLLRRWVRELAWGYPGFTAAQRRLEVRIVRQFVARRLFLEPTAELNQVALKLGEIAAQNFARSELTQDAKTEFFDAVVSFYEGLSEQITEEDGGYAFDDFWRDVIREMRRISPGTVEVQRIEREIQRLLGRYLQIATGAEPSMTWGWSAVEGLLELGSVAAKDPLSMFCARPSAPDLLKKQAEWALRCLDKDSN